MDANYFLARFLETEPLLTALGGPVAVDKNINDELDRWQANDTTPLFVFDGCPVKGEDEVSISIGREANAGTDDAWARYARGEAIEAVRTFGQNQSMWAPSQSFGALSNIASRGLSPTVTPPTTPVYPEEAWSAFHGCPFQGCCAGMRNPSVAGYSSIRADASQIAYLSKAELVGTIMGPRELLLYPITDPVIQEISWDVKQVQCVSRDVLMASLGVDESLFVDALLLTGTSFLPPFPAKVQPQQGSNSVRDVVNMLRTNGKHVKQLCSGFDDVLRDQPDWFDRYCRARMIVKHFIYIDDSGSLEINNFDLLTAGSHEYLGIRLPEELFHYLNTGLIRPDLLSWLIHSKMTVLPTLDGIASDEYKDLVLKRLLPLRELALGLVVPRLARGMHHYDIEVTTWFGQKATIQKSSFQTPSPKVASWDMEEKVVAQHFPSWGPLTSQTAAGTTRDQTGSLAFEVLALRKPDFVKDTIGNSASKPRTDSSHHLVSSVIWRFLHLRDYVNDSHELTSWGKALATAMTEIERTVKKNPKVPGLYEALLLAFELIRLDQLNAKPRKDEVASDETETKILLVSRCAVLLKLRHESIGYTGPLRRDMLAYLSQVSVVREADRDLVDAIVAHMFLNNKTKRERGVDDYVTVRNR